VYAQRGGDDIEKKNREKNKGEKQRKTKEKIRGDDISEKIEDSKKKKN
jgi:hypothetical protein